MSEEKRIKEKQIEQVSGGDNILIDDWKVGDFGKLRLREVNSVSVHQITQILDYGYAETIRHTKSINSSPIHRGFSPKYGYHAMPNCKITLSSLEKLDKKPDWIVDN